jgi:hypothetical protein
LETRGPPGRITNAIPPVADNPSVVDDIPGFREPVQTNNSVTKRQFSAFLVQRPRDPRIARSLPVVPCRGILMFSSHIPMPATCNPRRNGLSHA